MLIVFKNLKKEKKNNSFAELKYYKVKKCNLNTKGNVCNALKIIQYESLQFKHH